MHERKSDIVANRPDVADVIGDPLPFGEQGATPDGGRGDLDRERFFDRTTKSPAHADGGVAALPGRQLDPLDRGQPHHPLFDPPVQIAEALL